MEAKLEIALKSTGNYYQEWGLNANPGKTKVCAYHLNNEQAKRQLSVHWLGKPLEHKEDPEYLGITLDRSLTYKHHIVKLKKKLQTRVNFFKQLGNSSWGSNASTIRTAALSLVFSTGEFCAPVWSNSSNASKIDPILNEACRVITGCLKPTPLEDLYVLSGISPPDIRRRTDAETKLYKLTKERNPLLKYKPPKPRINRTTWLTYCVPSPEDPESVRLVRWQERIQRAAREELPLGADLPRKNGVPSTGCERVCAEPAIISPDGR